MEEQQFQGFSKIKLSNGSIFPLSEIKKICFTGDQEAFVLPEDNCLKVLMIAIYTIEQGGKCKFSGDTIEILKE